jgi:1,4-alpha-glucan branching enzyme
VRKVTQAMPFVNHFAVFNLRVGLLDMKPLIFSAMESPSIPPLGATVHPKGTTFRLWAPFVDEVAVTINDGKPIALKKEAGHPQDDDTVWNADVPGAKAGDKYKFAIKANGVTRKFIDPRARQLTGSDSKAVSVIVDKTPVTSTFKQPTFNQMVIYELHIGTFNIPKGKSLSTFTDAIAKLDYLKDLGINAVELMPVHENARDPKHTPADYNWGYDPGRTHHLTHEKSMTYVSDAPNTRRR